MADEQAIVAQLKRLGFNLNSWGKAEVKELPHILLPEEEIYELVNGIYEGGFALLVATDVRVLLIDKKPMNYLTVEDLRFDMISEIDYSHRLFGAQINISTGTKDLNFRSYNQARLRKLINHVQHCMADIKRRQTENQLGQKNHLERINDQLKAYLRAQGEYQDQLKQFQSAQEGGHANAGNRPVEPRPAPELSDYLFARSLLNRYEEHRKLRPGFLEKIAAVARPVIHEAPLLSKQELHDLWSAGVQEVFSKHHPIKSVRSEINSFEINPVSIIFSRLPMLIRSRQFKRPNLQPQAPPA